MASPGGDSFRVRALLLDLPVELLARVINHTFGQDLINLGKANKTLYGLTVSRRRTHQTNLETWRKGDGRFLRSSSAAKPDYVIIEGFSRLFQRLIDDDAFRFCGTPLDPTCGVWNALSATLMDRFEWSTFVNRVLEPTLQAYLPTECAERLLGALPKQLVGGATKQMEDHARAQLRAALTAMAVRIFSRVDKLMMPHQVFLDCCKHGILPSDQAFQGGTTNDGWLGIKHLGIVSPFNGCRSKYSRASYDLDVLPLSSLESLSLFGISLPIIPCKPPVVPYSLKRLLLSHCHLRMAALIAIIRNSPHLRSVDQCFENGASFMNLWGPIMKALGTASSLGLRSICVTIIPAQYPVSRDEFVDYRPVYNEGIHDESSPLGLLHAFHNLVELEIDCSWFLDSRTERFAAFTVMMPGNLERLYLGDHMDCFSDIPLSDLFEGFSHSSCNLTALHIHYLGYLPRDILRIRTEGLYKIWQSHRNSQLGCDEHCEQRIVKWERDVVLVEHRYHVSSKNRTFKLRACTPSKREDGDYRSTARSIVEANVVAADARARQDR